MTVTFLPWNTVMPARLPASGAKLDATVSTVTAGEIEMIAGDARVERLLKQACDLAARDRGPRLVPLGTLPSLAEADYAQGRLEEAERLAEEADTLADAGGFDIHARSAASRAKILGRRGQHAAAKQLADQAEDLPRWPRRSRCGPKCWRPKPR